MQRANIILCRFFLNTIAGTCNMFQANLKNFLEETKMNILLLQKIIIIPIALFSMVLSCTRNIKENKIITENAKYNFIFVSDSSEFKDNIRQKLVGKYRTQANINEVNIDKLKDLKIKDYDVIVILDTCMGWGNLNDSMNSFLNRIESNKNVVLFLTAGDSDWKYSNKGIDAITSASKSGDEEIIYSKIANKIDQIISNKKE
jgi:hypothetical protein